MATRKAEYSFYSYERTAAFLVFLYALYIYGPPHAPPVIADAQGVLANFTDGVEIAGVKQPFFFGLATAAAHVEDKLEDDWLDFARAGKVSAFLNQHRPEERNGFWTKPEVEIDLAAQAGAQVFRLGVDWGRIVPELPAVNGTAKIADKAALRRYREIVQAVRQRGMKVMLTLFHHSAPKWSGAMGGWTQPRTISMFREFTELVVDELGDLVDYWIPFNEPTVYVTLTYCAGAWPPGFPEPNPLRSVACLLGPVGNYSVAMDHIALAHKAAFNIIRAKYTAPIGMAHNIAYMSPAGVFDVPIAWVSDRLATYPFTDSIRGAVDFVGLNYYGQEFFAGAGKIAILGSEEYSDSGRAVYPDGLFHMLRNFHKRYALPIIITENGVADSADIIRPSYMVEHLLAVSAARAQGIPIAGYIFWTIADNWEWADGFCPKFGLAAVDRSTPELTRVIRTASYGLFKEIATSKRITEAQRNESWAIVETAGAKGTTRDFCRALEGGTGMTGFSGLDEPIQKPIVQKDWRFAMYEAPPYLDPVSTALRAVRDHILELVSKMIGEEQSTQIAQAWSGLKAKARQAATQAPAAKKAGSSKEPGRPKLKLFGIM